MDAVKDAWKLFQEPESHVYVKYPIKIEKIHCHQAVV